MASVNAPARQPYRSAPTPRLTTGLCNYCICHTMCVYVGVCNLWVCLLTHKHLGDENKTVGARRAGKKRAEGGNGKNRGKNTDERS